MLNPFKKPNDLSINDELQNVQRLEDESNTSIILPRALDSLCQHDENILLQRKVLIQSGKYKGNTSEAKAYKTQPYLQEMPFDIQCWCIGLLLGDASLQMNAAGTIARLKMQQAERNIELLHATTMFLQPWVFGGVSQSKIRLIGNKYCEFQTISHPVFNMLMLPFGANPAAKYKKNQIIYKQPSIEIQQWLTPFAIGAWFCTDGGRRDYGKNEGKALQFHTQGFDKEAVELLASLLNQMYGFEAKSKFDYKSKDGRDRYIIEIHARSYQAFVKTIGPYILPSFEKKLLSPRKPNSRFGF